MSVLFFSVTLAAYGLPDDYWQAPAATSTQEPHDWSELEKRLEPEACAQCHSEQFNDWRQSLHAHAFSPGLIGQFPDMGLEEANSCLDCHAPLSEQKFTGKHEVATALATSLRQSQGFRADADIEKAALPLRHAGVTCAACHVRGWQRFGPPRRGSDGEGRVDTPAHGGFTASRTFEQSQFCASCHQFPDEYAINGKPIENTVTEWRQSRFAREGVQCQSCHMPDRKHVFRGIHDPDMVRKGLKIDAGVSGRYARLTLASVWIGHAFPTYVTPKVVVRIAALDQRGKTVHSRQWEIGRTVNYDDGWKEISDTRLMPDEKRMFVLDSIPGAASKVRFTIDVVPDNFYKGIYRSLLEDGPEGDAKAHIRRAASAARTNDYRLYEYEKKL